MREKLTAEQTQAVADLADYRAGQACRCGHYKPPGHMFCIVCQDLLTPHHKIQLAHARPRSVEQLTCFREACDHLKGVLND